MMSARVQIVLLSKNAASEVRFNKRFHKITDQFNLKTACLPQAVVLGSVGV
jgi:hypothetical protein